MKRDLCIRCKKQPPEPGKTNCTDCAEYKSLYSAGRRDIRKVLGKCGICGGRRDDLNFIACDTCRKHRRDQNTAKKEATV